MIRTIFFWMVIAGTILIGLLTGPIVSIFFRRKEEAYYRIAATGSKIALWVAGVKVAISGLENIPQGSVIFVSNHQSLTDVLIFAVYLPRYFRFVAMQQVFDIPVFRSFMIRAGYVRVDQTDPRQASLSLLKLVMLLRRGESVFVFPEGTRSSDGRLQEFREGAAMLILGAEETVVPMAISGSIKVMHKNELKVSPGQVKVRIGKPITFAKSQEMSAENAKSINAKLRAAIEGLMHESLQPGF